MMTGWDFAVEDKHDEIRKNILLQLEGLTFDDATEILNDCKETIKVLSIVSKYGSEQNEHDDETQKDLDDFEAII